MHKEILIGTAIFSLLGFQIYSASAANSETLRLKYGEFQTGGLESTRNFPFQKVQFNAQNWKGYKQRREMLIDLTKSTKLVGMSRQTIHKLLGPPNQFNLGSALKDKISENTEWYEMPPQFGTCAHSPHSWFVLVYADDAVRGYRTVTTQVMSDREFANLNNQESDWH